MSSTTVSILLFPTYLLPHSQTIRLDWWDESPIANGYHCVDPAAPSSSFLIDRGRAHLAPLKYRYDIPVVVHRLAP